MTFESAEELAIAQAMAAERHPSIAHLAEFIVAEDAQGVMELGGWCSVTSCRCSAR
jgi:hypothetical protein